MSDFSKLNVNGVTYDVKDSTARNELLNKANVNQLPTRVSVLENDSGYITKSVNDLDNYTTTSGLETILQGYATTSDLAGKQDVLTAGTNIDITSNTISVKVNNTYSSSETIVGTWNNKPLYRKVVDFTAPSGSPSSVSVPALAIANAILRNYYSVITLASGYAINENYQEGAYAMLSMAINMNNGNVYFPQHASIPSNTNITLVVEYTKTTD